MSRNLSRLAQYQSSESEEEEDSVVEREKAKNEWIDWEEFGTKEDAVEFVVSRNFARRNTNKGNDSTGTKV